MTTGSTRPPSLNSADTRSRMAGDPPEVVLFPQLSELGLLEFDQGVMPINEGRACVQRMLSALEQLPAS